MNCNKPRPSDSKSIWVLTSDRDRSPLKRPMAKDKHVTNAEKPVPTYAVVLPEHAGKARRGCAAPVEVAGAWVDAPHRVPQPVSRAPGPAPAPAEVSCRVQKCQSIDCIASSEDWVFFHCF